jgi:hypothetical protein
VDEEGIYREYENFGFHSNISKIDMHSRFEDVRMPSSGDARKRGEVVT